MKIHPSLSMKLMSACEPGELFAFEIKGQTAFGFKLHRQSGSGHHFAAAVASPQPGFIPRLFLLDESEDGECLSFGSKALLQLDPEFSVFPNDFKRSDWSGVIRVASEGTCIRVSPPGNRTRSSWVDLEKFDLAADNVSGQSVFLTKWHLWANGDDVKTPSGKPLVTVIAVPPVPR